MKKIPTLFRKDPNCLGRVVNELNPINEWVLTVGIATKKFDGTAVAIIDGEIYKRYDVKRGRKVPTGAIPCQEADEITGHHPHWLKCDRNKKEDIYFFEAFDNTYPIEDGTYELCGEKVQGNPEKIKGHLLFKHGSIIYDNLDISFEGIKSFLEKEDTEGIVFHNTINGEMCKIRKKDFGIKR